MFESRINRGKANGYAPLDGGGKIPLDKLPLIQTTTDTGSLVDSINELEESVIDISNALGSFATTSSLQTLIDATGSFATTSSLQALIDVTSSFVTTSSFNAFTSSLSGAISGSTQITTLGFVSGSYETTGRGVISGSAQLPSGLISGSAQLTTSFPPKTIGSWTIPAGASTRSFTVDWNHSYQMWVNGNIPNGIITWNATVNVTNANVAVVGSQYGWYYPEGNALVLTSIPNQIVGVNGAISTTAISTTTSNTFVFGITNNSGTTQTINYGYIKVS
jgi:hypothetical protein